MHRHGFHKEEAGRELLNMAITIHGFHMWGEKYGGACGDREWPNGGRFYWSGDLEGGDCAGTMKPHDLLPRGSDGVTGYVTYVL